MLKVKPWGKGQGDFVEIDDDQYDPKFHILLEIETNSKPTDPVEPKPKRKPK